jgi:hypothetical protein
MKFVNVVVFSLAVLGLAAGSVTAQEKAAGNKPQAKAASASSCEMCSAVKQVADAVRCCDNCKTACPKCVEMTKKIMASAKCPSCVMTKQLASVACPDCKKKIAAGDMKGVCADCSEKAADAAECPGCVARDKAADKAHCANCKAFTDGCEQCEAAMDKVASLPCAMCDALAQAPDCKTCAAKHLLEQEVRCDNCRFAEKPCDKCQPLMTRIEKVGCAGCDAKKKG